MIILFDTNALTIPFQFKIDIFEEIKKHAPKAEYATLESVVRELDRIGDKKAGKMAKQMIKAYNIKIVKKQGKTDDALLDYARESNAVLFTNDKELRKRAKEKGIKTAFMRGKTKICMGETN